MKGKAVISLTRVARAVQALVVLHGDGGQWGKGG